MVSVKSKMSVLAEELAKKKQPLWKYVIVYITKIGK